MLTTNHIPLKVETDGYSIIILSGVAQIGSNFVKYPGTIKSYTELSSISTANYYQYCLIHLVNIFSTANLGMTLSSTAASKTDLVIPTLPSGAAPLALITFFSSDGLDVSLDSIDELYR